MKRQLADHRSPVKRCRLQTAPAALDKSVNILRRLGIASNPKQSRVDNAKAATTKANNYGATKAFAAGTAGGNATSKAV